MSDGDLVQRLRGVDVARLGLTWLTDEERASVREAWSSTWASVGWSEAFHDVGATRLARSRPLLRGPVRSRRLGKADQHLVVFDDPEARGVLWVGFSGAMPPQLWADAGASEEQLARTLAAYTAKPKLRRELPRVVRVVKRMDLNLEEVRAALAGSEPWVDDAVWCSAHVEDPWRSVRDGAGSVILRKTLEEALEQHPGRVPSLTVRTLWSQSLLTIERHPLGFFVFEARFEPATNASVIAELGRAYRTSPFPPDLPVDLAASLARGATLAGFEAACDLEAISAGDLAAMWLHAPDEPALVSTLRAAIDRLERDGRLEELAEVLHALGLEALLAEIAARPGESRLQQAILGELEPVQDGGSQ